MARNLAAEQIVAVAHPGACIADEPQDIRTGQDRPYTVFSPFNRKWQELERRPLEARPDRLVPVKGVKSEPMPGLRRQ